MNNKILLGITAGLLVLLGVGAFFAIQSNRQQQQIADYQELVSGLRLELESSGNAQVSYETELNDLRRQLRESNNVRSALESDLSAAQAQIDPDTQLLERQIRERVILELQQSTTQNLSRTELFKQLSSLDPQEMSQLMTLQGVYGGFLQELNPDDARMEELVDGFSNIISEQNQRRMEVIEEMRNNPGRIDEIRSEMLAINGPDAQMEALSYLLTAQEMAIYQAFRENQAQSGVTQTATFAIRQGAATGGAVFLNESGSAALQQAPGANGAIQIITRDERPN